MLADAKGCLSYGLLLLLNVGRGFGDGKSFPVQIDLAFPAFLSVQGR